MSAPIAKMTKSRASRPVQANRAETRRALTIRTPDVRMSPDDRQFKDATLAASDRIPVTQFTAPQRDAPPHEDEPARRHSTA